MIFIFSTLSRRSCPVLLLKILCRRRTFLRFLYNAFSDILVAQFRFHSFFIPSIHESTQEHLTESKNAKLSRKNLGPHECRTGYNLTNTAMSQYRIVTIGSNFCSCSAFLRLLGSDTTASENGLLSGGILLRRSMCFCGRRAPHLIFVRSAWRPQKAHCCSSLPLTKNGEGHIR